MLVKLACLSHILVFKNSSDETDHPDSRSSYLAYWSTFVNEPSAHWLKVDDISHREADAILAIMKGFLDRSILGVPPFVFFAGLQKLRQDMDFDKAKSIYLDQHDKATKNILQKYCS